MQLLFQTPKHLPELNIIIHVYSDCVGASKASRIPDSWSDRHPLSLFLAAISQDLLYNNNMDISQADGKGLSADRDNGSITCRRNKMSFFVNEELRRNNMDLHSWFWPVLSSSGRHERRWNVTLRDACEQWGSLSHCHTIYCTVSHGSAWVRVNSIWGLAPCFSAF